MKVGDLVNWNGNICMVAEIYSSKVWRTHTQGKAINWSQIEPEPFVRILSRSGTLHGVPQVDVKIIEFKKS